MGLNNAVIRRTDFSEGTDPAKSNNNKKDLVCHYWLFNHGFKYHDSVCNGCLDPLFIDPVDDK